MVTDQDKTPTVEVSELLGYNAGFRNGVDAARVAVKRILAIALQQDSLTPRRIEAIIEMVGRLL